MFLRNKKTDHEIFIGQLCEVRDWTRRRIDAGDPDISDIVYEMHDAAQALLEILDPQEDENEQS